MLQVLGMLAAIGLTAACWGVYGPVLHFGREDMHSPLRPFVCVGVAYFVIAIVVPLLLLARGEKGAWTVKGVTWSLLAGVAGALGALGVILALHFGGKPIYVMPLVFGGAPVVNTLLSAAMNRSFGELKAPFLAGLLLVITGAVTVLVFKPQPGPPGAAAATVAPAAERSAAPASAEHRAERLVAVLLATALAMVSWGSYGPVLHRGQAGMQGSRLRPLICIGVSYFLIAVLVPLALLVPLGDTGSWTVNGVLWSLAAGSLGAVGALGTILAFTLGGKPFTVMPVVFGLAPVINTLTTLALNETPPSAVSPFFLAGMLVVAVGAATVLAFGPRGHAPAAGQPA
ncbi:MAG: hypothetical protein FJ286_13435 [Planctomycetes bacterium]|nr:hypothetical protein [Planctomycetota bacterium]